MCQPKESVLYREKVKVHHLFLRGVIQTNDVFSVMNYERNQPSFSMKFKAENGGLYADKTLTLILPDLFIIQCGLNYKK